MSHVTTAKGIDPKGKAKPIGATGPKNDLLKVVEHNSYLLEEVLVQLKINNEHLSRITDEDIGEDDLDK